MRLIITRNITKSEEVLLPEWVRLALIGEKILAIKELRIAAGQRDSEYDGSVLMSLVHAKRIIESLMDFQNSMSSPDVIQGVEINEFSRGRIDAWVAELGEERDAVASLGLI